MKLDDSLSKTHCPRCQKEWANKKSIGVKYYCNGCLVEWIVYNPRILTYRNFINRNDQLVFRFEKELCEYASVKHPFIDIELPILPFDFTTETLQTYLVFS